MVMTAKEFKQQYLPYHKQLYRVAYHLTGNVQDAEDLLQDFYMKLWIRRQTLPAAAQNEAYLIVMMRNLYRDQLRNCHIGTTEELSGQDEPPDHYDLERSIEQSDEASQMTDLINNLPEPKRRVIEMSIVEGLDYKEIEQKTGLNTAHIRVIISRTKRVLKEQYIQLTKTWSK